MGDIQHEMLIMETRSSDIAVEFCAMATELGLVTSLRSTPINQTWFVVVFPCGSKVGWPDARAHMKALDELESRFGWGAHILRLSFGELPTGLVHDGERLV